MNPKNKHYLSIILIPLIIIIGIFSKLIYIYIFGETINLKVYERDYPGDNSMSVFALLQFKEDSGLEPSEKKFYYLDIANAKNYLNKLDKTVEEYYENFIEKTEATCDDDYNSDSKVAYAVLEEKNDYHDIKYITLNKPQNEEIYIECLVTIEAYLYDYEYYSINYNKEELNTKKRGQYKLYVDFDKIVDLDVYYRKNDLKFNKNGDIVIKFKVLNSEVSKI